MTISAYPSSPYQPRVTPRIPTVRYGVTGGPYVVAHRGGAGLGAENTMEAFSLSIALGVRYLETDIRTTSDGVAVVFHDSHLERITNGRGRVRDHSWRQLSSLMVAGSDEGIPRLDDLLGSFPGARFMMDCKDARSIAPLAHAVRRTNSAGRICVAGAWDGQLQKLRRLCGPGISLGFGWRQLVNFLALSATWRGQDYLPWAGKLVEGINTKRFAHIPWMLGSTPLLADAGRRERIMHFARQHDIHVMAWTIDDPADALTLLKAGVTGIITDRPDVLRSVWVGEGLWRPLGSD